MQSKKKTVCSKMMSPEDKALLEKARPGLMESTDLEGSDLLAQLRQRNALRAQQVEIIQEQLGEKKKVERLLDFLRKGKADTLDLFIDALVAADQEHVAEEYLRQPREAGGVHRHDEQMPCSHTADASGPPQSQQFSRHSLMNVNPQTRPWNHEDPVISVTAVIKGLELWSQQHQQQQQQQSQQQQQLEQQRDLEQLKNEEHPIEQQQEPPTKMQAVLESGGSQCKMSDASAPGGEHQSTTEETKTKCYEEFRRLHLENVRKLLSDTRIPLPEKEQKIHLASQELRAAVVQNLENVLSDPNIPDSKKEVILHSTSQQLSSALVLTNGAHYLGSKMASLHFWLRFTKLSALEDFWKKSCSDALTRAFYNEFVTLQFMEKFNLKRIDVIVAISETDYLECRKKLLATAIEPVGGEPHSVITSRQEGGILYREVDIQTTSKIQDLKIESGNQHHITGDGADDSEHRRLTGGETCEQKHGLLQPSSSTPTSSEHNDSAVPEEPSVSVHPTPEEGSSVTHKVDLSVRPKQKGAAPSSDIIYYFRRAEIKEKPGESRHVKISVDLLSIFGVKPHARLISWDW